MQMLRDAFRNRAVRDAAVVTLLCAACILLFFGRTIAFGFAPVDDGELIIENLAVHAGWTRAVHISFTTFDPELYIPLTLLSYRLTAAVSDSAGAFHAVNLLLHLCNAVLAYLLIAYLTGRRMAGAMASLVFAIHPVNVETVVWLSARKDLLMTFFGLMSANVLVRASAVTGRSWAVALFVASLLSKPSAMLAPAVVLFREKRQPWTAAAFGVVSLSVAVVAVVGKSHLVQSFSPVSSLLIVAKGVVLTVGKIFLIVPLRLTYDEHSAVSLLTPSYALSVLACFAVVAGIAFLRKKNPTAAGGFSLFVLLLAPALMNARAGSPLLAPDRYGYFPLVAFLLGIVALLPESVERFATAPGKAMIASFAVLFIVCAFRTVPLVSVWSSPQALYGRVLSVDPASSPSRVALARLRLERDDIEGAFELLRQGLAYGDDAFLHIGAAEVYAAAGQTEDALQQLQIAETFDPGSADPLYAEGRIYAETGKADLAFDAFSRAIVLDPSFAEAHVELAKLLMDGRQWTEAEAHLREAMRLRHSSYEAHAVLAELLRATGRIEEAQQHLNDAKIVRPQQ